MSPWPGNQWHGVGNESCDGRGRAHQLLSLCVYSVYSLHPGSCWDPGGGGPVSWSRHGPGTLLNYGKPTGAFAWKDLQSSQTRCHSLNQRVPLQTWLHSCIRGGELSHFQTRVRPRIRDLGGRGCSLIFFF